MKIARGMEQSKYGTWLMILAGGLLYAAGMNLFIVPLSLYSGGFLGISQIFRTLLVSRLHISLGAFDFSGVLYYLMNIPLFVLAYRRMGKRFFAKSIAAITAQTVFLSLIPIPTMPFIDDVLTSCMIGGIVCGAGAGLLLRTGSAGGGTDTLGVILTGKYRNISVGRLNIGVNACVYLVCALLFELPTAIYSIIYAVIQSLVLDRLHYQNINCMAFIFTKHAPEEVGDKLMKTLHRGVTMWDGKGAYTGETTHILAVAVSDYEYRHLEKVLLETDPRAFIIRTGRVQVGGFFPKHLTE